MPKQTGLHPDKALSAVKVRQVTKAGKYADGNGLYLVVDKTGAKRWLLRIVIQGRRRDMGLGGTNLVTLAEARELALKYRKVARNGGDPIEDRRKETFVPPTFADAARLVHSENEPTWKNPKHAQQWMNTLETYAFPIIGNRRIDHINTANILSVLSPIWLTKAETARRVRQRISTVMEWAKVAGLRTGDNPVDGIERGLPKQVSKQIHHKAMPYKDVPAFLEKLDNSDTDGELARLGLEFLILTAVRTSELLNAQWLEIDSEANIWIIPAERMKASREHRIPLSPRCMIILQRAKALGCGSTYLFPGRNIQKPFSNMVFLTMLKRMEVPFTVHGFRSNFRDWVGETTNYPRDLAEMALAHTIKNKVEAAYRRGDLLDRRREMMDDWAQFIKIQK
jgi:integrase